ncbi:MAG: conserved rane protein of unknown function [Blastococcus sp.]|nr:conserved rane protein of unknown function [Blastococcus sp.]
MTSRGPVVRALVGLGLVCATVIALASSIVLHGLILVLVLVTAGLAAGVAYNAQDDGRAAAVDAAWKAAAATVSVIVLVTGVVVLVGGAVAALVIGMALVTGGALWLLKTRRPRSAGARKSGGAVVTNAGNPAPVLAAAWQSRWQPPVSLLPTSDLGSEWLQTTSALASPVEPAMRQEIIRRRQETLDELERRDPAGFARWLVAGAATDSDPATFVRGERTTGRDSA